MCASHGDRQYYSEARSRAHRHADGSPHAHANETNRELKQGELKRQARGARRGNIQSRQEHVHTRKCRRSATWTVHKRRRMDVAGGPSGWRAQGEEMGREKGCYGEGACAGDGLTGPARLRGVRRWVVRACLCFCPGLVSTVNLSL